MRREKNQSPSNERTRYLNIVYFVESARSHTIRINLLYARWAVAAGVVICGWAIGSIFWIFSLQFQADKTRDRLAIALTTIFDYQIKNEKVFDIAYPTDATNSYYSELAQLPSNNPIAEPLGTSVTSSNSLEMNGNKPHAHPGPPKKYDQAPTEKQQVAAIPSTADKLTDPLNEIDVAKANEKGTEKTSPKITAQVDHQNLAEQRRASSETDPHEKNTTKDDQIQISGATISKASGKLSLVFNIKNNASKKAEGFIWAVAMITTNNGQTTALPSPEHTKIDRNTGDIQSHKTAYRFSILHFKNKEFDFKLPSNTAWKLAKLSIYFTDLNGQHSHKIDIPIDHIAVTSTADTPTTELAF